MAMKRCSDCLTSKPLEAFYRHSRMKDGRLKRCIACERADRAKHIDKIRASDKKRSMLPHRVEARLVYQKTSAYLQSHAKASAKWRQEHPERRVASVMVNNALRDGRINRLPCLICGKPEVEGHHPDYSQPLSVVWLCNEHHREAHETLPNGTQADPRQAWVLPSNEQER